MENCEDRACGYCDECIAMDDRTIENVKATAKANEKQLWKRNLSAVGDNPDYIELQIKAINKELKKDVVDTAYLHSKVKNIDKWLAEIDLANERADQDAEKYKAETENNW